MKPGLVVHVRSEVPGAVYIGRAGKGKDGEWGNPFTLPAGATETDREVCVMRYRRYLWERIQKEGHPLVEKLASLAGRPLECFCSPQICHGDVLSKAAVWAYHQISEKPLNF